MWRIQGRSRTMKVRWAEPHSGASQGRRKQGGAVGGAGCLFRGGAVVFKGGAE